MRPRYYEKVNPKTGLKRIVLIKTLLNPNALPLYIENRYHPFQEQLLLIRPTYRMFFNTEINRWIVYNIYDGKAQSYEWENRTKQYKNWLVKVCIVHSKNLEYREPGDWLYWELRKKDATQGGKLSIRIAMQAVESQVDELDPHLINFYKWYLDTLDAMNKDLKWAIQGRVTHSGQRNANANKPKPKKKIFIGARTGKVLAITD